MINHEGVQNLSCENVKKENVANDRYRKDLDPLAVCDPVAISFGILKKEEKDLKKEDTSDNEASNADLQYTPTADECENAGNTGFIGLSKNYFPDSKQNITEEISSCEKQVSSVLLAIHHKYQKEECKNSGNIEELKDNYEIYDRKYACGDCDNKYNGFRLLQKHINGVHLETSNYNEPLLLQRSTSSMHKNEKEYKCRTCQRKFSRLCHLKQHSVVHIKIEDCLLEDYEQQPLPPVQNEPKQKNYKDVSIVSRGKSNVLEDRKYTCDICGNRYTQLRNLKSHIEAMHLGISDYKCAMCHKIYSSLNILKKHTDTVHSAEKYECKVCQKKFAHPSYLQQHNLIHTTKKKYACADCGSKFFVLSKLIYHLTSLCTVNSTRKDKRYICENCGKKYKMFRDIKTHISVVHLGVSDYKCKQCDKIFLLPSELKAHNKTNGHKNYKKFECDFCKKKFSHFTFLKQHVGVHNKTKRFICEECGKRFIAYSVLKIHINRAHIKIKDYLCDQCGKTFNGSGPLDQHYNIMHKKLRNYECQFCYKKFQAPHHLQNHIICVHERVKNFACEQCGDRFLLAHHLRNHVKYVHVGLTRKCN